MPKQNTCSEKMLEKAFQLLLNQRIQFNLELSDNDDQIDLSPVFTQYGVGRIEDAWTSGNNVDALKHDFSTLNRAKIYFMRTGTMGGAGHYQLLHFDRFENGWQGFSSETQHIALTMNNKITTEGKAALMTQGTRAIWGIERGNYCIYVHEVTRDRLLAAANFVHDYRMETPDIAIEKLFGSNELTLNTTGGFITINEVDSQNEESAQERYIAACKQYLRHLNQNPNDELAMRKKDIIENALLFLQQQNLVEFTEWLQRKDNVATLATRRDSGFLTFVKALGLIAATLVTFGVASHSTYHSLFGKNATHGKKFLQDIEAIPSPSRRTP